MVKGGVYILASCLVCVIILVQLKKLASKEEAVAERTSDFMRRMGSDMKNFATQKTNEVKDRVLQGADRVVATAEDQAYRGALRIVARKHSLTVEEVESRLTEPRSTRRAKK